MKNVAEKINPSNPSRGFTLIEVVVVLIILAMTSSWAIPNFHRSILQGKVDRYMRNVESGLFSLRAHMGAIKGSCLIDFGERSNFTVGKFVPAEELLERQQKEWSTELSGCAKEMPRQLYRRHANQSRKIPFGESRRKP